jgi:hypothetical protein
LRQPCLSQTEKVHKNDRQLRQPCLSFKKSFGAEAPPTKTMMLCKKPAIETAMFITNGKSS